MSDFFVVNCTRCEEKARIAFRKETIMGIGVNEEEGWLINGKGEDFTIDREDAIRLIQEVS